MSSPVQNGQPQTWASSVISFLASPAAAGLSIPGVYWAFIIKSAQQTDKPNPKMTAIESIKRGCQAAHIISIIVGAQIFSQNIIEKTLRKFTKDSEQSNFSVKAASGMIVGTLSAPGLIVFNGQTTGLTPRQSLKLMTAKQVAATSVRETGFLFPLIFSAPVSKEDSKLIEIARTFFMAVVVSIIVHPADTVLTRMQNGMKVEKLSNLIMHKGKKGAFSYYMKGLPARATAVAGFSISYKLIKDTIESFANSEQKKVRQIEFD